MTTVSFTPNLRRHVDAPRAPVSGATVGEALDGYFRDHPGVRGYVLDDQGAVRQHVVVFVNGTPVSDRATLSDPIGDNDEIFVFQALSGG